jgi:hypothetical protein
MSNHRGLVCAIARGPLLIAFIVHCLLFAADACAEEKEPLAVVELGGAAAWTPRTGGSGFGPTAAVEFEPIKTWLVVEAGVTSLFSRGSTEWDTDVVFKKPFDLSPFVEFEPGLGVAWVHARDGGISADSLAGEVVCDFMFWPARERKFGLFLEPSYSYDFGKAQQSLGIGAGMLIAIP